MEQIPKYQNSKQAVFELLQKHKTIEKLVDRQSMPRHDLVQALVRRQNLTFLRKILNHLNPDEVVQILEDLPVKDQLFLLDQLNDDRKEHVLLIAPVSVLQAIGSRHYQTESSKLRAFTLLNGHLKEIPITCREDLISPKPVWIDMVAPSFEDRIWLGDIFGIEFPDPNELNDLESSARFYMNKNNEIHLNSDFLLDKENVSHNITVAFILYKEILFSIRKEELPVFRLQQLRALNQPNYVFDAKDVLLDLYAADAEYSAGAMEDVYRNLEVVGNHVLHSNITDEEAAKILSDIANEEDLNGRIRRNVMDKRRAVSFLIRAKLLSKNQIDDSQQILRDIESLDGHTSFLFEKINFLMDATVGFINVNQNKEVKRLTVISIVFMPLNILAGIGGMSEFSMMTKEVPWTVAYTIFSLGCVLVAWFTFLFLRFFEKRRVNKS
ncbi:MAG: magnesium transporter CorA [Desulfobacterales bacterium]|nr:magnesium transporter CorA [Desulfobacterales bacterium]